MGPRMMALPCPAKPNDTALTPSYSTGVIACSEEEKGTPQRTGQGQGHTRSQLAWLSDQPPGRQAASTAQPKAPPSRRAQGTERARTVRRSAVRCRAACCARLGLRVHLQHPQLRADHGGQAGAVDVGIKYANLE
jgi:hypothetical protein